MNLGLGLLNEINRMGGSDAWIMLRPDGVGVCYRHGNKLVRHALPLPFGDAPTESSFAALLEMADEQLS